VTVPRDDTLQVTEFAFHMLQVLLTRLRIFSHLLNIKYADEGSKWVAEP